MTDNNDYVQMQDGSPVPDAGSIVDRSSRIKGMGIFEIVLGALCALMTLLFVLMSVLEQFILSGTAAQMKSSSASIGLTVVIYAALTASLIWVGIGALKLRRWVPKVVLAINWPLFVGGFLMILTLLVLIPQILQSATGAVPADPEVPLAMVRGIMPVVLVGTIFASLVIYVVIPGLHILLFRGPQVQATCDRRDPVPRWTDDLPASVVGLTIWLTVSTMTWLSMGVLGYFFTFGVVLTGYAAFGAGILAAAVSGFLAKFVTRRTPAAWWAVIGLIVLLWGGGLYSLLVMDVAELYRRSGLIPEAQLAAMAPILSAMTPFVRILGVAACAAALIFLVAIRKHFNRIATQQS